MTNEVDILVTSTDKTSTGFSSAEKSSSKLSGAMSKVASVGKIAAVGLVGAAAGAVAFGKSAVAEARESQKVGAQTEAVIKSTGGAANVTKGEVEDLAGALSMKAGVDDELVQSGSNVLLTFKNIRNEVGKGNDIFNQATGIALDMSTALGTDMKSASILVGKALNDPIAGLSALSRVGVSFTEKQKKVIEGLVESGDTMKAQKLILRELNSEFAGSAEAQATAGDKLSVAWGNFQEWVGLKLLPTLDKLAVWFTVIAIPAIQGFVTAAQAKLGPVVAWLVGRFRELVDWTREHWPEISKTIQRTVDRISEDVKAFVDLVRRIWRKWGDDITRFTKTYFKGIIDQVRNSLKIVKGVIDVVTGIIKGDWDQVWRGIKQIFGGVWDSIRDILRNAAEQIRNIIRSLWDGAKDTTRNAWGAIKDVVRNAAGSVKDAIGNAFDSARDRVTNSLSSTKDRVTSVWGSIVDYIQGIPGKLAGVFDNIWSGITGGLRDAVNSALGLPMEFPGWDWPGPGGIGPKTLIPALARGGIARKPTLAVVGDGPTDEAIIPLDGRHGMGGPVTLVIEANDSMVSQFLATILRKYVRVKGGDVQVVLGS